MSYSSLNQKKLIRAIEFASKAHINQRRKDPQGSPYSVHVINVMSILSLESDVEDINVLIGGVLHDVQEDTNYTKYDIEKEFGSIVARIVDECSDDKNQDKKTRKLMQIEHAATISPQAQLVKLADKISNLRDIQSINRPAKWSEERIIDYFDWSKKVTDNIPVTEMTKKMKNILSKIYEEGPFHNHPFGTVAEGVKIYDSVTED